MPALRNSRKALEAASPLGYRSNPPRSSSPRSSSPRSNPAARGSGSPLSGSPLKLAAGSPRRTPSSSSFGARMAVFQASETQTAGPKTASPKTIRPKQEVTSPMALNPEAPVLRPVRGAQVDAKLAALTMRDKAATDTPELNVKKQVWRPRNDVFGSYVRKLTFDKNAAGLPPPRSIADLP